jgi:hypothetical protein
MRGSKSKPLAEDVAVANLCNAWDVEVVASIDAITDAIVQDCDALGYRQKVRFAISSNLMSYRSGQTSITAAASGILSSLRFLASKE